MIKSLMDAGRWKHKTASYFTCAGRESEKDSYHQRQRSTADRRFSNTDACSERR
jgi:hypothetical protein